MQSNFRSEVGTDVVSEGTVVISTSGEYRTVIFIYIYIYIYIYINKRKSILHYALSLNNDSSVDTAATVATLRYET